MYLKISQTFYNYVLCLFVLLGVLSFAQFLFLFPSKKK
jgi:hypothetical protein